METVPFRLLHRVCETLCHGLFVHPVSTSSPHYLRDLNVPYIPPQTLWWSVVAEWLGRRTQPEGRGFESRQRHGAVSVNRIP
jgi:hypothetical protein